MAESVAVKYRPQEWDSVYGQSSIIKILKRQLENDGLIYTERTNGKFVTTDTEVISKLKDEYAITLARSYFNGMKKIGLGKAESIKYLNKVGE